MLLKNKTAVITGCNRGIGKAILKRFAEEGADIVAVIRKENEQFSSYVTVLSRENNVDINVVYIDFSSEESVRKGARQILQMKKTIDILVNNVGISKKPCLLSMTNMETVKEVFEVNFFSHILMTQLISKKMIKQKKGSIVFISSTSTIDGWSNLEYVSSKSAINGAVIRLALELGAFGIRVNSVAPGITSTDMSEQMSENDKELAYSRIIMHRAAEVDEIADGVLFMASDMSRFVTGQMLRVDGGLL